MSFGRIALLVSLVVWIWLVGRLLGLPGGGDADVVEARPAPERSAAEPAVETRAGIYRENARVGEATTRMRAAGDGFVLEQRTVIDIRLLGEDSRVATELVAHLGADRSLRSVEVSLESGATRFTGRGEVRAGELVYEFDAGGSPGAGRVPLSGPVHVPASARAMAAAHLAPGWEGEFAVLDPLGWGTDAMRIRVLERDRRDGIPAWRLEETWRGARATVWMDDSGRVLAEAGPLGLELRLETGSTAPLTAVLDVAAATAIEVGAIPEARTRGELRLRFAGVPPAAIPSGPGQRIGADGLLLLERVEPEDAGDFVLPHPEAASLVEYLAAEPLLPADHPRLRSLVAEVLGGEKEGLVAVRKLADWVHAYLEKVPSAGVPDALAVLDAGRGDCNEHAMLFTALARAAGVPARVVAGLVFVEGRFVYHAWSEVRGAVGWLPVDPALGQFPADVTHIALVRGDLARQAELVALVGRLQLRVAG